MTIRHLKIFTTVADVGGMSKAAKVLHISQPSISQAVSELERYYDVKLFERLSQKLYLTREGELMLSYSRHILDSFEQLEGAMNQAASHRQLTIGCSVSVGTCLINEILDRAEEQIPNCEFHVMVNNSSVIEQALLNNQVDVAIVEGQIINENVLVSPVCEDELVVVCGRDHPLVNETAITYEMLNGQNYVSRESGSVERNQFERRLEERGIQLKRTFSSTSTEAIKNAVIAGRGIAIFSSRMVQKEVNEGRMCILPLKEEKVVRNFNFLLHKNKYVSKEIQILQNIFSQDVLE